MAQNENMSRVQTFINEFPFFIFFGRQTSSQGIKSQVFINNHIDTSFIFIFETGIKTNFLKTNPLLKNQF
jgi:hypothetical protein